MPTYVTRCPNCGDREQTARMSEGKPKMACPSCQRPRPQVYFAPQFTEDRLAQWKGPLGNGWSNALGAPMPATRAERDRLAKQRGVEFCSLAELRADNREAAAALDYYKHVSDGGEREKPRNNEHSDAWVPAPVKS